LANVTLVGIERVRKSLIGGREWKPALSSQVGDERFHFKLNLWRQSPQSSPIEHLGPLLAWLRKRGNAAHCALSQ
jgi:hypothetical protein